MSEARFTYSPLENPSTTIRVLHIDWGLGSRPIHCVLKHVKLDAEIQHICLSYMWGKAAANRTIHINGRLFCVRQNLFEFLHAARKIRIRHHWLWIDAICINQDDTPERNAQVRIMSNIYRLAKCVIIYPGAIVDPRMAYSTIILWAFFDFLRRKGRRWPTRDPSRRDHSPIEKMENFCKQLVTKHLEEFLALPYWNRMWIVQEIALARKVEVLCYKTLIPWSHLKEIPLPDWDEMTRGWYFLHSFDEERYRSSTSLDSSIYPLKDICSVLLDFSNRHCTIITDRIYGLLSMLNAPEAFPIDYDRTAATVVLDVLEHFQFKYLERNGKEIPNALGLAVKAIHVSYALRCWPLILCYTCFQGSKPEAACALEREGSLSTAHLPRPGCDCREYPLRFFWTTAPPPCRMWSEAYRDQDTVPAQQFRQVEEMGQPGWCDHCDTIILGCKAEAKFEMKRLNDGVLLVTVEHDLENLDELEGERLNILWPDALPQQSRRSRLNPFRVKPI